MVSLRQKYYNLVLRFSFKHLVRLDGRIPFTREILNGLSYLTFKRTATMGFEEKTIGEEFPYLACTDGTTKPNRHVFYLHGGGMALGGYPAYKHLAAKLAGAIEAKGILLEYPLAPQAPYPAAVNHIIKTYENFLSNGYDPRQTILVGDSAGGNLSLVLLQMIVERGLTMPAGVILFSPWTDLTGQWLNLENKASDVTLTPRNVTRAAISYANGADLADPHISPINADYKNMPPMLVFASEDEILLDNARQIVKKIPSARLMLAKGVMHGWPIYVGRTPEADLAIEHCAVFMNECLGSS